MENEWGIRLIIAFINFLMWTGNTTILLMAGIMGIDPALYEASAIDGASAKQQFRRITMPMLKPIMLYVMITSMIGGLQLFDIPNLIVNRGGTNGVASTVVMDISTRINSSQGDMGVAGAESVVLFLAAGLIGIFMFRIMQSDEDKEIKARKKAERKVRKQAKGAVNGKICKFVSGRNPRSPYACLSSNGCLYCFDIGMYYLYLSVCYALGKYNKRYIDIKNDI